VTVHDRNRVVAIDPTNAQVDSQEADIGAGVNGIGVGEGAVWVSNYTDGTVSKIDPSSKAATQIDLPIDLPVDLGVKSTLVAGPAAIGVGFGSAWVSDVNRGVVYRIDPATNGITATIRVGKPSNGNDYASDIAAADGSMWVTSPESRTIVRIDPATNSVEDSIQLPYTPNGLTVGYGSVWATINP